MSFEVYLCRRVKQRIVTYRKNFRGVKTEWYPFVGIYFVNNGTNIVSFEMVRTKKNILSK